MLISGILLCFPICYKALFLSFTFVGEILVGGNIHRIIAYLILKEGVEDHESVKEKVKEYCEENHPESHIPDEYVFISELPLTRAGKIDYRVLEEMAKEN